MKDFSPNISSVGRLRLALKDLPDDQPLYCQVTGSSEYSRGAWNMYLSFAVVERSNPAMAVLSVWHPDLKALPDTEFGAGASSKGSPVPGREIMIEYLNWRNEQSFRKIIPTGKLRFGTSTYYETPQWLMEAFCLERQELREFALTRITQMRHVST